MNTTDLVHFPPRDLPGEITTHSHSVLAPSRHELMAPARNSILCAREYLAREQRLDGSWAGRTTGEVSSLTQVVLLFAYLGRERSELAEQAARAIRREQRSDGGWARTPGGPFDLDVSVLAYFALKVVGEDACGPKMAQARRAIREHGGADRCNHATRNWLALCGQIDYDLCTPVMPEWLLTSAFSQLPPWIDEIDLAARAVAWALRPRCELEVGRGIRELIVESPRDWRPAERDSDLPTWRLSRWWSRCERAGFVPFRRKALERASFLLTEEAIETSRDEVNIAQLAWRRIALSALGYPESSRAIKACDARLKMQIAVDEASDEARSQPNTTLTADTSLAIRALVASGFSTARPVIADGLRWLMEHRAGLAMNSRRVNELAPLLESIGAAVCEPESAAFILPELRIASDPSSSPEKTGGSPSISLAALQEHGERLGRSLILMQRQDGGWTANRACYDVRVTGVNHGSNGRRGASSADVTGNLLAAIPPECYSYRSAATRAVSSLRMMQRGDGSWDSATNARYLFGTASAIRGLIASGADHDDQAVAAGANWLLVHQHESGGWGESDGRGVDGDHFQAASPTAIQTAWVIVALVAAGMADHEATRRGVSFLLATQADDGSWRDTRLVERDSPRGPWYRNDLRSTSWSLLAIARWAAAIDSQADDSTATLRLVCHESAGQSR